MYEISLAVESYLAHFTSTAYFCDFDGLYIFSLDTDDSVLGELGDYIQNYAEKNDVYGVGYKIFNAEADYQALQESVHRGRCVQIPKYEDHDTHSYDLKMHSTDDAFDFFDIKTVHSSGDATMHDGEASHYQPKVLLVEDDDTASCMVRHCLVQDVQYCVSAQTGQEALSVYQDMSPDIVLLDIGLPDISGLKVLDRILEVNPQAHIVMLSAHTDMGVIMDALNKGAHSFIPKPFKKQILLDHIRSIDVAAHAVVS